MTPEASNRNRYTSPSTDKGMAATDRSGESAEPASLLLARTAIRESSVEDDFGMGSASPASPGSGS